MIFSSAPTTIRTAAIAASPAPACFCREPKSIRVDLSRSFMVGDRWRDIEAGANAGCATVCIDFGYREKRSSVEPSATVNSLSAAADWILRQP